MVDNNRDDPTYKAIVKAASVCFASKGMNKTTYKDISKGSGIPVEVIKGKFKNKNAIALSVQFMQLELMKKVYLATMPEVSAQDTIKFIMRTRLDFVSKNLEGTTLFFNKSLQGSQPWSDLLDQLIWQLSIEFAAILEKGVREKKLDRDVEVNVVVRSLVSFYLTGLVTIGLRAKEYDADLVWDFIKPQVDYLFSCLST